MKFISPEHYHCYIRELAKHMDIELVRDRNAPKKSNKALIIWNPYAYLVNSKHLWKKDLYEYFRAENRPVYVVERGALPETIYLDKNGYLAHSTSYNEEYWNHPLNPKALERVNQYICNFTSNNDSLEKQQGIRVKEEEFIKGIKNKIKVFVPMQVPHDTVITLWADWIKNVATFQDIIRLFAKQEKHIVYLVKNHPLAKEKMLPSKNIKIVDNYHYKDCIKYSNIVLTINSGIGLQAMMWGKPVITVGKAYYQIEGVNYKAKNGTDIIDKIKAYSTLQPDMEKVKRFIYYLRYKFYTHCIMKKLEGNKSEPKEIKRICYEHPLSQTKITMEIS